MPERINEFLEIRPLGLKHRSAADWRFLHGPPFPAGQWLGPFMVWLSMVLWLERLSQEPEKTYRGRDTPVHPLAHHSLSVCQESVSGPKGEAPALLGFRRQTISIMTTPK